MVIICGMVKGGARIGAGRPKGAKGRKSRTLEERMARMGVDPLEQLVEIAVEARGQGDLHLAVSAFKELARYVYPMRKAVDDRETKSASEPTIIKIITRVPASPEQPGVLRNCETQAGFNLAWTQPQIPE
jgi:hypothetical protein